MKTLFTLCLGALVGMGLALRADTVTYTYDTSGRVIAANYGSGKSASCTYDTAGNITRKTFAVIADTDNDGMADTWENLYFGDLSRDGTGDYDGDGFSDLAEFLANTLPNNPASLLKITQSPTAAQVAGGSATIEWASVAGKTYRVQFKTSLTDPQWTDISGDVVATGATASKVHSPLSPAGGAFYRVVVLP